MSAEASDALDALIQLGKGIAYVEDEESGDMVLTVTVASFDRCIRVAKKLCKAR